MKLTELNDIDYLLPHNIHRPKTAKMSLTASDWPTLQPMFRVHRQNHGVCVRHYSITVAHSQGAAGIQSVSETDADSTLI